MQSQNLCRNASVVTRIDIIGVLKLLLEQVFLDNVDTQIRLQVNTCSILGTQLERSTTRISDSLLRSIPNVNALSISPTFLITSLVARTVVVARHVRLDVLRSLVPNQTFQLNAGRNDQSVVRSNGGLVTISLLNLQSNSVILISILLLITSEAIPAIIRTIDRISVSLSSLINSELAIRVDGLIRWPRSEVNRSCNLDTSLEDTLVVVILLSFDLTLLIHSEL